MKHPKDRGDRLHKKQNAQHKALFTNGLFRSKVEKDRRKAALARAFSDEQYALEEGYEQLDHNAS